MPNLSYLQARIEAASSSSSTPPGSVTPEAASTLSLGAIIGIAVGGSVVLFAALTPVLIILAKWQDRRRAESSPLVTACCPISSSTFAAITSRDGQYHEEDRTWEKSGSRRLRKKSVASEQVMFDATTGTASGEGGGGRRESLPVLPPVVSRPGSFNFIDPFAVARAQDESGDGTEATVKKQRSPDKQRGYMIYQHRRKTSWIDEDALHGPSITSPKKGGVAKRNPSWVANFGRGLGRSLSRRFSVRRGAAGASQLVGRSPTLPYTEAARGSRSVSPTKTTHMDEKITVAEEIKSARDIEAGIVTAPVQQKRNHHYPTQTQVEQRGAPPQAYAARREDPSPRRPTSNVPMINNNYNDNNGTNHRNTVALYAAQQLAGGARLPVPMSMTMPAAPIGPRPRHRRMTQSNTDAELQAILRRTAERLQDGKQSTRRQTMMYPGSAPSTSSTPRRRAPGGLNSIPNTPSRGTGGVYDPTASNSGNTSPTKSQKSAPAVLAACDELRAELDGSSSLQVPVPTQGLPHQSQTHNQTPRRHARQISQISQASMVSEADSLVVSRRGSQQDAVQTPLSSPSRSVGAAQTSPASNNPQMVAQIRQIPAVPAFQRPFSMASTESSALSTVYSEEETSMVYRSPPANGDARAGGERAVPNPKTHMERQAMQEALLACDAFVKRSSQMSLGGVGGPRSPLDNGASPQPLRVRKEAKGQTAASSKLSSQSSQGSGSDPIAAQDGNNHSLKATTPKAGPPCFTIHALDDVSNDPFTAKTPSPVTRLSKLFSPLPAKQPSTPSSPMSPKSASSSRTARQETRKDQTPTRSPSSRRRVVPPPHVLRAGPVGDAAPVGVAVSAYVGGMNESPVREPASPAPSEGGLSSVYDSYAYRDSSYSSYGGGSGAAVNETEAATVNTTARNSISTQVTAPTTAATSPTRGNSNSSSDSPSGRASRCGYRVRDIVGSQQNPMPTTVEEEAVKSQSPNQISITVKAPSPTQQQRSRYHHRRRTGTTHTRTSSHHSTASTESSRYSQDGNEGESANPVPPLHLPYGTLTHRSSNSVRRHQRSGAQHSVSITHPGGGWVSNSTHLSTATSKSGGGGKYTRVASAVAELRRMNSTVSSSSSSVTATSSATAELAAFKRAQDDKERLRKTTAQGHNKSSGSGTSPTLPDLRGGGFSPSRSGTRAGGRNYLALGSTPQSQTQTQDQETAASDDKSPSSVPAVPLRGGGAGLRTHARKLAVAESSRGSKRASIESLGLYDEDGFLKNSPERQGGGGFLSAAVAAAARKI
ncbi:hypothetical protein F4810DRAFT_143431 [Camillea tinctor]|nr:hypothetical protein F4810DRAFT_143431 [Camillea tinctor]